MVFRIQQITAQLIANPKRLFLADSLGAFLTVFFLMAVLYTLEDYFGMPGTMVVLLSTIALAFAIYSLCCYYFVGNNWRPFLHAISIANVLYCCLAGALVVRLYSQLTALGVAYFVIEIILICGLVMVERWALSRAKGDIRPASRA